MGMSTRVRTQGRACVVAVDGEVDVHTSPDLRATILHLVEGGSRHLIVDLDNVSFLDSTGLGVLVGSMARAEAEGGSLHLVCANERILKTMRITGLSKVFTLHPSVDYALAYASR